VRAVTHYRDAEIIAEVSRGLGEPMRGRQARGLTPDEMLAGRGW
jgi:pyridoxal 5'-phosphate synthase pdxS subunit